MIWSISANRTFGKCQRQWFYQKGYASWAAKKVPERRLAYVLSKLTTISGLRGTVVDDVLSDFLVNELNDDRLPDQSVLERKCLDRFDKRIQNARLHKIDEQLGVTTAIPSDFTILHEIEYGEGIQDEDIDRARSEIQSAIKNLYELDSLLESLRKSSYVISQRGLTYKIGSSSVKAFPDIVAFYAEEPPVVLDWKVHHFGNSDAARQLASYAFALMKARHNDFSTYLDGLALTSIRLWEAQLLIPKLRVHQFSEEQYLGLEEFIASRSEVMTLAVSGRKKSSDFLPIEFSTALEPQHCQRCAFKRICWESDA